MEIIHRVDLVDLTEEEDVPSPRSPPSTKCTLPNAIIEGKKKKKKEKEGKKKKDDKASLEKTHSMGFDLLHLKPPAPQSLFPERRFCFTTFDGPQRQLITMLHKMELMENGYTVVHGVLSGAEVTEALELGYEWIEGLGTGIDRTNFHLPENRSKFAANMHGIVEYPPACHSPFAWYMRSHKGVRDVFSQLWGTAELVTSFDRVNFSFGESPKEEKGNKKGGGKKKRTAGAHTTEIPSWAHADQDSRLVGLQCIQGFVNLKATDGANGGGLFILKGSHRHHNSLFQKMKECDIKWENKNWVKLPQKLDHWMVVENGCDPTVVRPLPAGSMVLWDSRAIHANVAPKDPREIRIGGYVCMVPMEWAMTAKRTQVARRRKAMLEARGTTHWPHILRLFSNNKPFRHPLTENTIYNPEYLDETMVLSRLVDFFKKPKMAEALKIASLTSGFESTDAFLESAKEIIQKKKEKTMPALREEAEEEDFDSSC